MARIRLTLGPMMAWQQFPLHNPRCHLGWFKQSSHQLLHLFHHPHLTWTGITLSVRFHRRQSSSPAVPWARWVLPRLPARTSLLRQPAQCHKHSHNNRHSHSLNNSHYRHSRRQQHHPVPPCRDLLAYRRPRNLLRDWETACPRQRMHWVRLLRPLRPRSQHLQPPRPVTSLAL